MTEFDNNPYLKSSLYRLYMLEREEILKHKWIESQKAGRDVGFEWALVDWTIRHRAEWRKNKEKEIRQAIKS